MEKQSKISPVAVGVEDAYRSLGIGRTAFYGLVKRGQIRLIKLGKRSLVPCTELERVVTDGLRTADQVVAK